MGVRTCLAGVVAVYSLNGRSSSRSAIKLKRYLEIKTRKCNLELLQSLPRLKKTKIALFQSPKSLRFICMNHWRAPLCLNPLVVWTSLAPAWITRTSWMSLWKDMRLWLKVQSLIFLSHFQVFKRQKKASRATDKDLLNFVLMLNKIDQNDLCIPPRRPQDLRRCSEGAKNEACFYPLA